MNRPNVETRQYGCCTGQSADIHQGMDEGRYGNAGMVANSGTCEATPARQKNVAIPADKTPGAINAAATISGTQNHGCCCSSKSS